VSKVCWDDSNCGEQFPPARKKIAEFFVGRITLVRTAASLQFGLSRPKDLADFQYRNECRSPASYIRLNSIEGLVETNCVVSFCTRSRQMNRLTSVFSLSRLWLLHRNFGCEQKTLIADLPGSSVLCLLAERPGDASRQPLNWIALPD
jgi:hypothetical protein